MPTPLFAVTNLSDAHGMHGREIRGRSRRPNTNHPDHCRQRMTVLADRRPNATTPSLASRTFVSAVVGVLVGAWTYYHFRYEVPDSFAHDFTWALRGARALLAHQNPYEVIKPTGPFPFNAGFKYPLLCAVLALPVAWLSPAIAVSVFNAVGAGVLAYALQVDGRWRLPILLSGPFLANIFSGQWSLLTTAAALLPAAGWLAAVKPQTGLASLAYRPSWSMVIGGAAAYIACLAINPLWPIQMIEVARGDPDLHFYVPAVTVIGGQLLLMAVFRWRTREARLLLAMALVPQAQFWYTGLAALLVARTYRQSLALSALSAVGYYCWRSKMFAATLNSIALPDSGGHQAEWMMLFVFLPALIVVFRHPNIATPLSGQSSDGSEAAARRKSSTSD